MSNEIKGLICAKAISILMTELFQAERENMPYDDRINKIVWPVLKETQKKLTQNVRDEKIDLNEWGIVKC